MNATALAKGAALTADGAHVRSLLRDNAAAARGARESKTLAAMVDAIEEGYDQEFDAGRLRFRDRTGFHDAVVGADFDLETETFTLFVSYHHPLCEFPARAFEAAAWRRIQRNRDARLAGRAGR